MAHSIEARVPFCDHRFVESAFRVPPQLNLLNGSEKHVLREAFKHELPPAIYQRRKYALPESRDLLLYERIADELNRNILAADNQVWGILDKRFILRLNEDFKVRIEQARDGAKVDFTGEIRMHEKIDLRVKHVFLALTFLRWFDINFAHN